MSTWVYHQRSGALIDPHGVLRDYGYAGAHPYVNVPTAEWRHDLGPIPTGTYTIGAPHDSEQTGPCSLPLEPALDNKMYGRSDFLIHGDTPEMNQTASTGCIIMPRAIRDMIVASDVKQLEVKV